ncbi:MAG TPA: ArsA family ATPase [Acidimicrobiales bacterium]|nr:ArsA family ATPase [Acidimicrobiales bacterium]
MVAAPPDLLDRRLLFVTGKGGVGKTTVAAALAYLGAERGKKTLVCEFDAKGNLGDFLEAGPTGFSPREVSPRLWAMSMDTEESLKEYLGLQLRMPLLTKIGPLARIFEYVATAAPGVREVLTVGKVLWEVRDHGWDLVVVDASASGHIVGQLTAPQAINDLVSVGLIRQQTDWMVQLLSDPATTGVVITATPEEMPVNETLELAARLRDETSVDVAGVVVNRVLPELFGRGEGEVFDTLREPVRASALSAALGGDVAPLLEAAELAVALRRGRAAHLERLRAELHGSIPMLYVPYLFLRSHGMRATRVVAENLGAELGH